MELWFKRAKKSWLSKLISLRTVGPYSHVEAVLLGRWAWSAEPGPGIRRLPIGSLNRDEFDVVEVSDVNEREVHEWFVVHEGESYDIEGILDFAAGVPGGNPRAWSCAECICEALRSAGLFKSIPSHMVHPTLLWAMALAREDTLKELKK